MIIFSPLHIICKVGTMPYKLKLLDESSQALPKHTYYTRVRMYNR